MAETLRADCEHASQKYLDGAWRCASCGGRIPRRKFDPSKFDSVRFNGLHAMKAFREYGMTESQMTRKTLEEYKKKNPDKDPIRVDGKDRWI